MKIILIIFAICNKVTDLLTLLYVIRNTNKELSILDVYWTMVMKLLLASQHCSYLQIKDDK